MCPRGFLAGASSLLILPSARSAFGDPAHERLNLAILGDMDDYRQGWTL